MLKFLILSVGLALVAEAHMSMKFPIPRKRARVDQTKCNSEARSAPYLTWEQNEPMVPMRPCTCHGLFPDATVRNENVFNAGATITVSLAGTAFHNGGQCSFWWSTDNINFKKFVDVNHCTTKAVNGQPINIKLPATMDSACGVRCTLAWTWTPVSSASCEIYMTCADIRVVGARGGGTPIQQFNFNTQISAGTCIRADPVTGWSALFTPFNENGMAGGGGGGPSPGTTAPKPTTTGIPVTGRPTPSTSKTPPGDKCPLPNVPKWTGTGANGACGPGVGGCDVGMCCSQYGFCGPDLVGYDAAGNPIYSPSGKYGSQAEAEAAYCNNAKGDFRLVPCCAIVNGKYDANLAKTCIGTVTPVTTTTTAKPTIKPTTIKPRSCVPSQPCKIEVLARSNAWWMAVVVHDSAGRMLRAKIANVELRTDKGWTAGSTPTWYPEPFVFGGGIAAPATLRITLNDKSVYYACNTITKIASGIYTTGVSTSTSCPKVGSAQVGGSPPSTSNNNDSGSSKTNIPLIVGLSVGGGILMLLCGVLIGYQIHARKSPAHIDPHGALINNDDQVYRPPNQL